MVNRQEEVRPRTRNEDAHVDAAEFRRPQLQWHNTPPTGSIRNKENTADKEIQPVASPNGDPKILMTILFSYRWIIERRVP